MCTLLWVLGGLMLAKLIMFRRWRRLAYGYGGWGGCGRGRWHHRRWGGGWGGGGGGMTILIGGLDHDWSPGGGGGGGGGYRMRHTVVGDAEVVPSGVRQKLASLWKRLELNQRQREEVDEIVATLESELGRERLDQTPALFAALAAVARETFTPEAVQAALGPAATKHVVDALEHLHYILTPEQRARLVI